MNIESSAAEFSSQESARLGHAQAERRLVSTRGGQFEQARACSRWHRQVGIVDAARRQAGKYDR